MIESQLLNKPEESTAASRGTMRSAVLASPREWEIQEAPVPEPGADEVLIQSEGCGVCASGLPVWEGREWFEYPQGPGSLGHEGWGRVIARGRDVSAAEWPDGTRVAFLSDGAFASHICLSADQLLKLPEALEGKPFPAEPVGCAINILARTQVEPGQKVVIVGMGFLGGLLLQLLRARGAQVSVVSRRDYPLEIARDLGAAHTVQLDAPWQVRETLEACGWGAVPRVIEAVGNQAALDVASELVAESGRLIIAGYHQDDLRQVNMQSWNWRGIDVINAHERDPRKYTDGMREAIRLASEGTVRLEPLLTHRYPLDAINTAYADLKNRPEGFIKGWIDFGA